MCGQEDSLACVLNLWSNSASVGGKWSYVSFQSRSECWSGVHSYVWPRAGNYKIGRWWLQGFPSSPWLLSSLRLAVRLRMGPEDWVIAGCVRPCCRIYRNIKDSVTIKSISESCYITARQCEPERTESAQPPVLTVSSLIYMFQGSIHLTGNTVTIIWPLASPAPW